MWWMIKAIQVISSYIRMRKKEASFGMRASRPFSLLAFVFYYYLYKISPLNWMSCFLRFQDVILGRDLVQYIIILDIWEQFQKKSKSIFLIFQVLYFWVYMCSRRPSYFIHRSTISVIKGTHKFIALPTNITRYYE